MINIVKVINNLLVEYEIFMEIIFLLLIFTCFIVSFVYDKKRSFIWKLVISTIHSIFVAIITFAITSTLLGSTYYTYYLFDTEIEHYSNLFIVINFFGYISIILIPMIYIIVFIFIAKVRNENQ